MTACTIEEYHGPGVGDWLHKMLPRRAGLLPVQQTDLKRITESCETFIFGPVCTCLRVLAAMPQIKRTNDSDVYSFSARPLDLHPCRSFLPSMPQ